MENVNLFLLKIILASVLLNIVIAKSVNKTEMPTNLASEERKELQMHNADIKSPISSEDNNVVLGNKHRKHSKKSKSKRDAYEKQGNRRYWASRSSNVGYGGYSNNLPLYLVYNSKVGAYYPYYKYPKENTVRRSSNLRKVPPQ